VATAEPHGATRWRFGVAVNGVALPRPTMLPVQVARSSDAPGRPGLRAVGATSQEPQAQRSSSGVPLGAGDYPLTDPAVRPRTK
jgi:hypothetical protein